MTSNWKAIKLKDACSIDKAKHSGGPLPYVGLEHIESGTGKFAGVHAPANVRSSTFRFNPQHLLYGRLRPYLNKVLLPEFEGHCSSEIFPLKVKRHLDRRFLFYWITWQPIVDAIDKTSTGARMPRANVSKVLEFDFFLPPLPEQKRIVAILDEGFAGIEAAMANIQANIIKARELFEGYLNAVFALAPSHWVNKRLDQICRIKHGFAFRSQYFAKEGNHILLTPGSFWESGGFRDQGEKTKYYVGEVPPEFLLQEGDFLIAMTEQAAGLLGSSLIVPQSNRYLHNQRLGLVDVEDAVEWHNDFFFHQFNTRAFRGAVQATASGVKVRHTSPKKLGAISVKFPPTKAEQARVANQLTKLKAETRRLEFIYQRKLAVLAELKQSLLQKAFSGELTAESQPLKEAEVA